jgi:hypothetical protein
MHFRRAKPEDGLMAHGDHFHAPGNGLREPPTKTELCPYLVFEDFTTTGLEGDLTQSDPLDGVRNSFFYFFRAEGRSGGKGGVWECDLSKRRQRYPINRIRRALA